MTVADSSKSIARHFERHRFCAEIIGHVVRLYFRFPRSLRHVETLFAERGIDVSFQTVSEWVAKFGREFAPAHIAHTLSLEQPGDKSKMFLQDAPRVLLPNGLRDVPESPKRRG